LRIQAVTLRPPLGEAPLGVLLEVPLGVLLAVEEEAPKFRTISSLLLAGRLN